MKFGVHLPQFGRVANPEAIQRAALNAEELEFDDLWVSDHLAIPNESLAVLRSCWEQDPVSFHGARIKLEDLRVLPQPGRRIPIWVGGTSAAALRRAVCAGDGWLASMDALAKLFAEFR